MTVTVITSTIGRKELRQCIESVKSQTYPCRHFVFINGLQFHDSAREILKDYPDVTAFYIPEDTGDYGAGPSMADVFAAGPFLTRSDWVFFLNDDDFYDPNHVESVIAMARKYNLKWAYALRKFVDQDGKYICVDDWNSLGAWPNVFDNSQYLVDNSCFAVERSFAVKFAHAWTKLPIIADRCFLAALKSTNERFGCTGQASVNYRLGTGTAENKPDEYLECSKKVREIYADKMPWRVPSVFNYQVQE